MKIHSQQHKQKNYNKFVNETKKSSTHKSVDFFIKIPNE